MTRHDRIAGFLGLAVLLVAAGCGSSAPASGPDTAPVSVTTVKATSHDVPVYLRASGTVVAEQTAEVAATAPGYVSATRLAIGTAVKAGDVIVALDESVARLQLQQASASVAEAEVGVASAKAALETARGQAELEAENARGIEDLFEKGGVSRQQYEQAIQQREAAVEGAEEARLQVVSAEASLESAKVGETLAELTLAGTQVRAPFDGFLSVVRATAGEFVAQGTVVAQVVSLDPVEVEVQIPEADLPAITVGLDATATVVAYPQSTFAGTVAAVGTGVSEISRAVTAKISFPNADSSLRPGMFATVQIARAEQETAVFVPTAALVEDPNSGSTHVFTVSDGTAVLKVVETGDASGDQTRILAGVAAEDDVVTTNLGELRDGIKVTTGS